MKYFTAKINGKDEIIGNAGETKRYLKAHPEIESVIRWWWSGNDLIECEDYSRQQILGATVKQSETGATAHWAHDHHFAPNPGVIEGATDRIKPNPLVCEFCGNFHDAAYSDCATGEEIRLSPQAEKGIEAAGEQKNSIESETDIARTDR